MPTEPSAGAQRSGFSRLKIRLSALARRIVTWQIEQPFVSLLVAVVLTLVAFGAARGLTLQTQFERLLPENHYLVRWADSFRETRLSESETIFGSGRVVIFADMLRAVLADIPRATIVSLALTVVIVIASVGLSLDALLIVGSLLAGVAWLFVFVVMLGIKLNFLNFMALPITFGVGVDYAVNIMQRYRSSDSIDALGVVRQTGGAVVLCSLTTILGYLALVSSQNLAVHSLGLLAALGEICCLVAATVVLPAIFLLTEARRKLVSMPPIAPRGARERDA